jgi:hypothetical protein
VGVGVVVVVVVVVVDDDDDDNDAIDVGWCEDTMMFDADGTMLMMMLMSTEKEKKRESVINFGEHETNITTTTSTSQDTLRTCDPNLFRFVETWLFRLPVVWFVHALASSTRQTIAATHRIAFVRPI